MVILACNLFCGCVFVLFVGVWRSWWVVLFGDCGLAAWVRCLIGLPFGFGLVVVPLYLWLFGFVGGLLLLVIGFFRLI